MPWPGTARAVTFIRPGDHIPTGWFWDGEQDIYHDGSGGFFVGGLWYHRPDLLVDMPPPPPGVTERLAIERQRLSTPWPTYGDAWRAAKERRSLAHFLVIFGLPIFLYLAMASFSQVGSERYYGPFFGGMLALAGWPFCWWWIYYSHLRKVDTHKAFAFLAASYGALAVGTHYAANRPTPGPLGVPSATGSDWQIPPGAPGSYRPGGAQ